MMKSFVSLHFSIFGFLTTFYLLSYLLVLEYFIYTSLIGVPRSLMLPSLG